MKWAIDRIDVALGDQHYPRVLLKGAAYVAQGLPIAAGRMPSDLDILVPHSQLSDAQTRLILAGWKEIPLDEHDQRYYREWSHEVPPMRHPVHPIELDLHHNILPPVARTTVDADVLLERVQPCDAPGWTVLHPVDQVLHSAAHLFLDSEARDRVRDLLDLDGLLRHFAYEPTFWGELPRRASELGLTEPLALACSLCVEWFDTPVPSEAVEVIGACGPAPFRRLWLVPLLRTLLTPTEPGRPTPPSLRVAATIFLARYHINRMPMRLLLPHIWHKLRHAKDGSMFRSSRR